MPTKLQIFFSIIFVCAIIHTFLTSTFYSLHEKYKKKTSKDLEKRKRYRLLSEVYYFLSEVELVFGFWIVPLIVGLLFTSEIDQTILYLRTRDYTYAIYMTVVVVFASTRPVVIFAEKVLEYISRLGGNNAKSWWWTILTVGPILDIILKEPGAMTISSILLAKTCFPFIKDTKFRYATLALLFINISLCGLLAPYTSRSLFLVATQENWNTGYTIVRFGWKAIMILLINNSLYYYFFKKHFAKDSSSIAVLLAKEQKESPPLWLTMIHLLFLAGIVLSSEYPPIFLGIFFLFLGVHKATSHYQGREQGPLNLKPAIFVGFFFASLLIHGELQSWWAVRFLQNIGFAQGLLISTLLSSVVDNAVVLYFLDQIKPLSEAALYAIVVGALSSGGLTLMANAPNLIGYSNLRVFFGGKISLVALFLAALPLTLISLFVFWLFI